MAEIARTWKILPSDVYELRIKKPLDFALMRGYVRAKEEWNREDYDVHPPNTSDAFFNKLKIYGDSST